MSHRAYLCLCLLGEDGGAVDAVKAAGKHSDYEQVKGNSEEVDTAFLLL